MSATAATLSAEDYEKRKLFLTTLKILTKTEQEELYRMLKGSEADYSENSNGVFFDVCKLPAHIFERMYQYVDFCKRNVEAAKEREEQTREMQAAMYDSL
jgi:hypothetical protein